MKKTTFLYLINEILPIFFLGLMIFTVILLMDKILKMIELMVSRESNLKDVLMIFLFISPSFLTFTTPIAVLLGTLLAFGRLSGDNEITAFKASGVSLYQLFLPVFLFSLLACLFTGFLVFYGLPWGNRGFKATLYLIAQSKTNIEIKERVFNDLFEGLVIYVDRIPLQGKRMEGILIYDERDKGRLNTIFAKEGFLINNPKNHEIILRLESGDIHRLEPKTNIFQKIKFESYDLKLEMSKALASLGKKLKEYEMSIEDIKEKMEGLKKKGGNTAPLEVEIHKRYAIPFACMVFGLIGVPLGIQPRRSAKSYGLIFSILILMTYYICSIAFEIFAAQKVLPPLAAAWAPNLIFGSLGVYLLIKTANESPFKPVLWLTAWIDLLQKKWKGISGNA
ncbi:MAG: LPS export ABC transporter permease LptF [Thermodesulfobacteriota bacterium]